MCVRLIDSIADQLPVRACVLRSWTWELCSIRLRTSQTKGRALKPSVILGEFFNLDKLICVDIQEVLSRVARRPRNLQTGNLQGLAQSNVLLERRSAKRSS